MINNENVEHELKPINAFNLMDAGYMLENLQTNNFGEFMNLLKQSELEIVDKLSNVIDYINKQETKIEHKENDTFISINRLDEDAINLVKRLLETAVIVPPLDVTKTCEYCIDTETSLAIKHILKRYNELKHENDELNTLLENNLIKVECDSNNQLEAKIKDKIAKLRSKNLTVYFGERQAGKTFQQAVTEEIIRVLEEILGGK